MKEAQAKLRILDSEMARREADLYKFQQSITGMSDTQLDELGSKLGEQFAQVLFDPSTTGSQRDLVFNELATLIAEQVKPASAAQSRPPSLGASATTTRATRSEGAPCGRRAGPRVGGCSGVPVTSLLGRCSSPGAGGERRARKLKLPQVGPK